MKGVFVTGTDTNVGKTVISAWLVRGWAADYWKPVQTGAAADRDADAVRALAGMAAPQRVHPSTWELEAPLSPHIAADLEGRQIALADFALPATTRPLVVEGAGGILVPLNGRDLMVDLAVALRLPVLIVARSGLGTINHTLLTVEALRRRDAAVAGVVMAGPPDADNRRSIERFAEVPVLAEIPLLAPLTPQTLAALPPPSFAPELP